MVCLGLVQKDRKIKQKREGNGASCCSSIAWLAYADRVHVHLYPFYYYVLLQHCYMNLPSYFIFHRLVIYLVCIYGFT